MQHCPNDPLAWALISATNSYSCKARDAVSAATQALRLSPMDRYRFYYLTTLAIAHYVDREYEKSVMWGRIAVNENPNFTPSLRYLAAALAARNDTKGAREVAQVLLLRQPKFTLKSFQGRYRLFSDPAQRRDHVDHLRLAGLPDE